jgi:hypothetical protein
VRIRACPGLCGPWPGRRSRSWTLFGGSVQSKGRPVRVPGSLRQSRGIVTVTGCLIGLPWQCRGEDESVGSCWLACRVRSTLEPKPARQPFEDNPVTAHRSRARKNNDLGLCQATFIARHTYKAKSRRGRPSVGRTTGHPRPCRVYLWGKSTFSAFLAARARSNITARISSTGTRSAGCGVAAEVPARGGGHRHADPADPLPVTHG